MKRNMEQEAKDVISVHEVDEQLQQLGLRFRYLGRPEVRELANVLQPGEKILHCLNGFYQGALGLLSATDRRVLLIDKRPLFLNLEDIRYEMITQIDYAARAIDSTIIIFSGQKTMSFRSFRGTRLRSLCSHVQQRVWEIRQHIPAAPLPLPMMTTSTTSRTHESPMYWRRRPGKFLPGTSVDNIQTQY